MVCSCVYALRGPDEGRYYNRETHKRSIKPLYINLQGEDSDTTGVPSLYTTAYTKIDIEWFLEPSKRQGIHYYAKSTCNGSSPIEEECGGEYNLDVWVINKKPVLEPKSGEDNSWEGSIIKKVETEDFDWWEDDIIRDIDGDEERKKAIYALLMGSTDANASINGGPVEQENSNSGSCGSGSCGPGDEDWGQSVADGTF